MTKSASREWIPLGVVFEGEPIATAGVDLWKFPWESLDERVLLFHPTYPSQPEMLDIYRITTPEQSIEFAAGEVSAGVYAFFITAEQQRRDSLWRLSH